MTATATPAAEAATTVVKRSWKAPISYAATAIVGGFLFILGTPSGVRTTFSLSPSRNAANEASAPYWDIPVFGVPALTTVVLLVVLAVAIAGVSAWGVWSHRRLGAWLPTVFGLVMVLALFTWAGAGRDTTNMNVTSMLAIGMVAAGPLVFGSLAGLVNERSGVINIAIEGQLLFGAFLAALVASATGNAYAGLLAAPFAGALVGAALALFAVRYWVDQIVVGVVLNVLVIGITNFFYGTVMTDYTSLNQPIGLPDLPIPVLAKIPILGPILFDHNLLVYLMYITVAVLHVMLFKSRWGLRVRSVGEHPKAADTVGINVNRTRVRNVIFGGAIAGLGGAFFTVAAGLAFGKEMTGGKGFIALAAMILGRWSPRGALAAGLLFGLTEAFRQQLGIMGSSIPEEFVRMTPYLATIFAVAGIVGHARPPAAEGTPYKK